MPIYEYRCEACGEAYEALIRGNEAPECPSCGSAKAEKKLSAFAAHAGGGASPCDSGACGDAPSCPTGTCPFA